MSAKTADWYDTGAAGITGDGTPGGISALDVYLAAINLVPEEMMVIDLGCGTGRFAKWASTNGFEYLGIDFAPAVIAEARRYCPDLEFRIGDLRSFEHDIELPDQVCYVLLEVLEHLDDDRDLLQRLAPGQPVVLSVPNFGRNPTSAASSNPGMCSTATATCWTSRPGSRCRSPRGPAPSMCSRPPPERTGCEPLP